MKTIEILVGIPCSGKSTYCKNKRSICRDVIREIYFSKPYIYSSNNELKVTNLFNWEFKRQFLDTDLNEIVLDNTHCKEKYIDEIIKKHSNYNIKVKFFDIPLWKAHYRNIVRYFKTGKWIPIKIMNSMYKNYSEINRSKYEKYNI